MSLRAKLVLWYTGVFGASGCILVTALYSLIAHKMQTDVDKFIEDEYEEWARITLEHRDDMGMLEELIRREIGDDRRFPVTYRLHDTTAQRDLLFVVDERYRAGLAAAAPIRGPAPKKARSVVRIGKRARPFRLLTGPLDPAQHPHLVLQVGMDARQTDKRAASLRKYLFSVLFAVVLVAALGGWFLASRSLKPIDKIVAELGQIESRNLAERLEVGTAGDEVDRLRQAINRMLERLNVAFDRLRSFTADAAHELRTPLAALQCRLEVAINKPRTESETRAAVDEALQQVAELDALVDNLLLLARMDAEPKLWDAGAVDLGELLAQVGEPFGLLAEDKGVALSIECKEKIETEGNALLLRRLFGNLLDNAVRYTPAGGSVAARAIRNGEHCLVTVADTGIGIEPQALDHVFDRFYRADGSRSRAAGGSGLGLSIVRRVAEVHHGGVTVESRPGEGTVARVWLPCHASTALASHREQGQASEPLQ